MNYTLSELKKIHSEKDINIGPADDSKQGEFDESLEVREKIHFLTIMNCDFFYVFLVYYY